MPGIARRPPPRQGRQRTHRLATLSRVSWQAVLPGGTLGRSRGNGVRDMGRMAGLPPLLPAPHRAQRVEEDVPARLCAPHHLKHRQDQGRTMCRHHHLRGDLSCPGSHWVPADLGDPVGGRENPRSAAEGLSPQPRSAQTLSPCLAPLFPHAWSLSGVPLQGDTPPLCLDHPPLTFSPTTPGAPSWPGSPWGDRNRLRAAAKTPTLPTAPCQTHCQHPQPRSPEHSRETGTWGTAGTPWPGSHLPSDRVSPWDQADPAPLEGPVQAGGKEWVEKVWGREWGWKRGEKMWGREWS